jgi:hypothetical protein
MKQQDPDLFYMLTGIFLFGILVFIVMYLGLK